MSVWVDEQSEVAAAAAPTKRRRLPVRFVVFTILAVTIVAALVWMLSWYSPVPVRQVVVSGAAPDKQAEVLAAAAITDGTAIRDVDTQGAVDRIRAVPGIQDVEIVLQRPFTIDVRVSQRFPFAVTQVGQNWVVLDQQGRTISEGPERPQGLPAIAVQDGGSAADGVAAVGGLPPEIRATIKDVLVTSDGHIGVSLASGVTVDWGRAGQDELKGQTVAQLLAYKPKVINVSVPERPALTGDLDLPKANQLQPDPAVS